MIFNQKLTKYEYWVTKTKIRNYLGITFNPKQITKEQIDWLKDNVKQFDAELFKKIIDECIIPIWCEREK